MPSARSGSTSATSTSKTRRRRRRPARTGAKKSPSAQVRWERNGSSTPCTRWATAAPWSSSGKPATSASPTCGPRSTRYVPRRDSISRSGVRPCRLAAVSRDFTGPLADLDLPRLGLLALVERDGQHAVLELGVHRLIVNGGRQGEAAEEPAVPPLVQEQVAFFPALVALFLAFGGDGQRLVFQGNIDVVLAEPGQLGLDVEMVGVFADVNGVRGEPLPAVLALAAEEAVKHRIEFPLGHF